VSGSISIDGAGIANSNTGNRAAINNFSWYNPNQGTFEIEFYCPVGNATSTLFSLTDGSLFRFEIGRVQNSSCEVTVQMPNPTMVLCSNAGGSVPTSYGRVIVTYRNDENYRIFTNSDVSAQIGSRHYSTALPTQSGIGYRRRFGDYFFLVNAGDRIRSIRYWSRRKSEAWCAERMLRTSVTHLHSLGDSFENSTWLTALKTACAEQYRIFTQDGVGGSTVEDQLVRYAATPQYFARTLIVNDGSNGIAPAATVAALNSMAALGGHDRWVWLEPWLDASYVSGSAEHTTHFAHVAEVAAAIGSAHYVPTFAAAQAANNGDANDLADVAAGLIPRSLRGDTLHPNAAGYAVRAAQTKAKLDSNGW